jgi:putative ABC transport system permease protein
MVRYYLQLAVRSLRRNFALSALMVIAIALGIGASMTTYAAFRATGGDPIPWKSRELFVPQIDLWGFKHRDNNEPPDGMDYLDTVALIRAHVAKRQAAIYPVGFSAIPDVPSQQPFSVSGHAVSNEFFAMVDAPLKAGSAWSAADDEARTPVVVLSQSLNEKLFGQQSGVGNTINLDGHRLRVIGVLDRWRPEPLFYDLPNSDSFGFQDDFFVPFNWAIDQQIHTNGNNNCTADPPPGWDAYLNSSCVWMSVMVELPSAADAESYRKWLDGYARQQQQLGRFAWAPNNRLRDLPQWLEFEHVVPDEVRIQMMIAFGFLAVCLVNVIGLMLAKFMRRSLEIGVRRALGASKHEIYKQFLVEAGVIGVTGGALGFGLSLLGQRGLLALFDVNVERLKHFDPVLLLVTLALALLCTLLAGLYPTIRAAAVQPAWQLKSN